MVQWQWWAGFISFLILMLVADLGVFHRRAHEVRFGEALAWTGLWVGLALSFAVLIAIALSGPLAGQFIAGYLVEWSLSVDNVLVFALILRHFAVPAAYQHRVLFWGVVGAICLRLGFILGGSALLHHFSWVIYPFGAVLLVTAIKILKEGERGRPLDRSLILRVVRRHLPVTGEYAGKALVARRNGRLVATPLLAVLVLIEATDVVFAIDSVPAVFSLTRDAFIAFASNALAVLGLRSLFFVLSGAVARFRYLKLSLALLLGFVGVKMALSEVFPIPNPVSLSVIAGILGAGMVASWAVQRWSRAFRRPLA